MNTPTNTGANSSFGPLSEAFVHLLPAIPGRPDHYGREHFEDGLSALGFSIRRSPAPRAGNVLVLWNRYDRDEQLAQAYERAGGVVLVTENAWLGPEGKDEHFFALCKGHHNGAGEWYVGQRTRSHMLDTAWRPWRGAGDHIVVLPQRGMGERGVRMEKSWTASVVARLHAVTQRPIIVRDHPGPRPHPPIMHELEGAWCAVTWGSGAAIKAICAGIPVFYEFPKWIGAEAAVFGIDRIEAPYLGSPGTMLRKLSWAQWSRQEIATGEPFRWLLSLS